MVVKLNNFKKLLEFGLEQKIFKESNFVLGRYIINDNLIFEYYTFAKLSFTKSTPIQARISFYANNDGVLTNFSFEEFAEKCPPNVQEFFLFNMDLLRAAADNGISI